MTASAQTGRGTLTGSVVDAQGAALQGAKVLLDPTGISGTSDATGQFTLTGVPAGNYTATFSYSGFDAFTKSATVVPGQPVRVDAILKVSSSHENVQVYAGRQGGEVEAINRTFTADNIINVLPADVIKSLPNANVADALGRLPSVTLERDEGEGKYVQVRGTEPRLTNTTVDGINIATAETVRQVKLDIIPSDLVESVQINKTLQPNMEGDGIGGSVDLRTKSAGERPTIALESTGGYTPIIGGRPAYQFDGTLGKRFLEGGKLGLLGGGSYDWNGRGINDVEPGPVVLGGYDERDYQYYRSRLGFAGTVDYRLSNTSNIYLKGLYSLFHNYGNRWDYNVGTNFTQQGQPDGQGSTSFGAEIRRPVQDIGSIQLGGRHVISRSLFSWDVESSVGRTRDNGYSDASFAPKASSNLNAIQFGLDLSNPLTPKLTTPAGVNIFDPTQYEYTGQRINNYYSPETDLGFGGSLATSYSVAGHSSSFEVGGRFRNVHKFANQDTRNYVPIAGSGDPSLSMTNFLGSFTDPNYYGKTYTFGPTVDYNKVSAFTAIVDDTASDKLGNNFNFVEKVGAGYLMNTINVGKFRVLAGVRFENTSEDDAGNTSSSSTIVPTTKGSYLDVLPSASVRYSLTPLSGLRLVYGRGLSRPNFSDLVSFATISPGGVRTLSSIGNPNLKAEHADNVDLLYEQSLNPVGLLQAGVFYKHLADPIVPTNTTLPNGTIQTQPNNAGSAYVYGFEIAFQQRFTYLPGLMNGLGLSANYGYSASQVTFPAINPDGTGNALGRTDRPDLLRQAPHTWNISPTYDKRHLSARLGLSYNAANIFSYNYTDANAGPLTFSGGDPKTNTGYVATGGGITGPNGDNYLYSHLQVDLQGSYRLPKGFTAVAYGLNLNNEVFGFYYGNPDNPIQREFYKPTFGGGLRWSPHRE
jgi:TonB-dependent receptor